MRYFLTLSCLLISYWAQAQELFVMAEPASNAPANSLSVRLGQSLLTNEFQKNDTYSLAPEVTWGMNKNLMFRGSAYLNSMQNGLELGGGSLYAKYRFHSTDDLQSHFRMAAFASYSYNKSPIIGEAIDLSGMNSGIEAGIIATQLIKKTAVSATLGVIQASRNDTYALPDSFNRTALNYSLSVGRLMHPKKYINYKQTNVNAMLELVGQTNLDKGRSYLDIVPSIQFIINSQARIDIAYKKELYNAMDRVLTDGFILKLEYTFFNVTK